MPSFETLAIGEKTAVVFDIGSVYTKCGFAKETGPRFILPTEITLPNCVKKQFRFLTTEDEKRKFLVKFLHEIYYRYLLVNPKDRRVVIVESVLCTTKQRELLADVLFNHFEVPSALFAPSHLVALFTLGISSALVLDCGYMEAQVIPVYEGYSLLNAWQTGDLGSKRIHESLKELLVENAKVISQDVESNELSPCSNYLISEKVLEDLKVRTCFISPASRAQDWKDWLASSTDDTSNAPKYCQESFVYTLDKMGEGKSLQIPSRVRELSVECLHTGDADQITLANLLLRAILATPIDLRRPLAENIVLIGGTINIPGFHSRLMEELNICLDLPEFESLKALKNGFKFHNPPSKPNYTAWLGGHIGMAWFAIAMPESHSHHPLPVDQNIGAIFGALDSLRGRSLSRSTYQTTGTVPDWTTYIDSEYKETERIETTRH